MGATTTATDERRRDDRGRYAKSPTAAQTPRASRGKAPVTLRRNAEGYPILYTRLDDLGHKTSAAKARVLGCGEATASRMKTGEQEAGPTVIAAAAVTFPDVPLTEFFDFHAGTAR
jgi:hypothetical protein